MSRSAPAPRPGAGTGATRAARLRPDGATASPSPGRAEDGSRAARLQRGPAPVTGAGGTGAASCSASAAAIASTGCANCGRLHTSLPIPGKTCRAGRAGDGDRGCSTPQDAEPGRDARGGTPDGRADRAAPRARPLRLAALAASARRCWAARRARAARGRPPMALLYGDSTRAMRASRVAALERQRIPHRIAGGGSRCWCRRPMMPRLRLMPARGWPARRRLRRLRDLRSRREPHHHALPAT
jgi:hypothetical protein